MSFIPWTEIESFHNIKKFTKWISNDVQKETKDEMEASNLTWEQISKMLTTKARICI